MLEWARQYGAMVMVTGGISAFLVVLALDVLAGWSLPYPYSLAWLFLAGIPAAGVALLFHEVQLERAAEEAAARIDEKDE
jgi:hypothetical protein